MSGQTNKRIFVFILISSTYCRDSETHSPAELNAGNSVTNPRSEVQTLISRPMRSTEVSSHATSRARTKQGQLCPQRCNGTRMTNPVRSSSCFHCTPCICEPYCEKYGICCPQVDEPWRPPPLERSQCRRDHRGIWIRHVVACNPDFPASKSRNLCESRAVARRRDTVLPVTSAESKVTYANIHCASCNDDDTTAIEWTVSCSHNQYFYNVVKDTQYDDLAIQAPEICQFSSLPLGRSEYHTCVPDPTPSLIISSCNLTGSWEEDDELTREACEEADWSKGDVVSVENQRFYANVMCALCNENIQDWARRTCYSSPTIVIRPATGLLQSNVHLRDSATVSTMTTCSNGQWKHPQVICELLDHLILNVSH